MVQIATLARAAIKVFKRESKEILKASIEDLAEAIAERYGVSVPLAKVIARAVKARL